MKLDVKVTNLGKFEQGTIKVRPVTVLTGPNGTGKSFFTKTLYSLLNVVNRNAYHINLRDRINEIGLKLDRFDELVETEQDHVEVQSICLVLSQVLIDLETSSKWNIGAYLDFVGSRVGRVSGLKDSFDSHFENFIFEMGPNSIRIELSPSTDFESLMKYMEQKEEHYQDEMFDSFRDEMLENFQVRDLNELTSIGKNSATIEADGFNICIEQGGIRYFLSDEFINDTSSLSKVVFFESPAYWKVKDALQTAKMNTSNFAIGQRKVSDILTGVPKYFYDLDQALKTKIKSKGSSEIRDLATSLKDELGGEFVFSGDSLVFKDSKSGRAISKNLVSFGMTNLGMIHTLLKNNVITKGSFVFIDEPETNLHPDWQVLLMSTLIKLAEHEVNVVIATHSMDMLKALEIGMKKRKDQSDDDFMAIHFLDTDGQLLEFDSDQPMAQLAEARSALNSTYESLYFEGSVDD
jgi:predicted ATP-binding protein involved in virulence